MDYVRGELTRPWFGDKKIEVAFIRLLITCQKGYGIEISKTIEMNVETDCNWPLPPPSLERILHV